MTLSCLILHYTGDNDDLLYFFIPNEFNEEEIKSADTYTTFVIFVIYGYFFFNILLIFGIIMDEKLPIVVRFAI